VQNPPGGVEIHLFGHEANPETWAIAKCDLFMKLEK
jgi:type I restriction-modification system DNA methylase subunit